MLVSVVVPCYNSRLHVECALDSIFSQTHPDLELICVDDGSVDGTVDLLNQICRRSPIAMQVISMEQNSGACAARNKGLQVAAGGYVQFLDSDDSLEADKIAHQLQLIQTHDDPVDIVAADYLYRGSDESEIIRHVDRRGPLFGLLVSKLGITSANLWRTEAVRSVGGFNVALRTSNEYELMFRLLQHGANVLLDSVPKTVVWHRSGSLSQATGGRRDFCDRFVRLRMQMLEYMERRGLATPELRRAGHASMLRKIRELWTHDPAAAERLYREAIPTDFFPSGDGMGIGYRLLFRFFGFRGSQRIAGIFGRW